MNRWKNLIKAWPNFLLLFLLVLCTVKASAQEISFGEYGNYTLMVSELDGGGLDFGSIITGEGIRNISLSNAKVLSITGIKYLDVIVEINADNALYLNGNTGCNDSCSIPFTLKAGYTNAGVNAENTGRVRFLNVNGNNATTRFPILHREYAPPGPPPTPPHKGYNPSEFNETAYLYLYGSVNVGEVDAGSYSGNITVTIYYD